MRREEEVGSVVAAVLPPDVLAGVQRIAAAEGLSISATVRRAIMFDVARRANAQLEGTDA